MFVFCSQQANMMTDVYFPQNSELYSIVTVIVLTSEYVCLLIELKYMQYIDAAMLI